MFFDLIYPLPVLFVFQNVNWHGLWPQPFSISTTVVGKFSKKLYFSELLHDVCLRVLFLIRPLIANVDFYSKMFMEYAVTPIKLPDREKM